MKTKHTYVCLLKFTEQGSRAMRKTAARAERFRKAARKFGVDVVGQYWTLGQYDGVLVLEAARPENALHLLAELAAAGNVTTQTLPAYAAKEMRSILKG